MTCFQNMVRTADGSGVFVNSKIEVIDRSFNVQLNTEAGLLNQNATSWMSTIYDGRLGLFPLGVTKSGVAPAFDVSPMDFAAHLIASTFNVRMLPNPTDFPIVLPTPPGTLNLKPPRGLWRGMAGCFLCGVAVGCCLADFSRLCCIAVPLGCAEWLYGLS